MTVTALPERVAFVLVDGIGDVTIPQLGNRTPLEAADVPHLDAIAGGCAGAALAASGGSDNKGRPARSLAASWRGIAGLPSATHTIRRGG